MCFKGGPEVPGIGSPKTVYKDSRELIRSKGDPRVLDRQHRRRRTALESAGRDPETALKRQSTLGNGL